MSFDGADPYFNSSDERAMRQRNRVRKKIQQRNPTEVTGGIHSAGETQAKGDYQAGKDLESEENSAIVQCLSNIQPPQVTTIERRHVVVELGTPGWERCEARGSTEQCHYELLLSDKGKDSAKFKTVYCGDGTQITLNDLKPGMEYHVRAFAFLSKAVKGALTEAISFRTLPSEPDPPQPPKLMNRSKASFKLKWNAAIDNGSKITAYILEWNKGEEEGAFEQVYSGVVRQCDVTHLQPSTCYLFRLAAVNDIGHSLWSETAAFFTSGSVPSPPEPPSVSQASVKRLSLAWTRRPQDQGFLLQMEDEATGHGFIPVYNGPNSSCSVQDLNRNTPYKFRLSAKNEEGQSKWSDVVIFHTLPDVPASPARPRVKGRVAAHSFAVAWDPPRDDGGAEVTKYIVELGAAPDYKNKTAYECSDTEQQFEQLLPGHQYYIRVACCSVGGQSKFSDSCTASTEPVAPGACCSLKLQGRAKATSLHLRWEPPASGNDGGSPVTQYAIQMTSPDGSVREAYHGPGLDCVVAGLQAGKLYQFQVRGFNKVGAGPWCEALEATCSAAAPEAPAAPRLTCPCPTSAGVTWQEPESNGSTVREYRLQWATPAPEGPHFSPLYTGPKLSYEAKGLTPATTYFFRVQAVNKAGVGQFSPVADCQTPPSTPGPPTALHWQPLTPTSLLLSWQPPPANGSPVTSYNISVSDKRRVVRAESALEYTLDDLQPNTQYRVQVQAVNGVGPGPYSSVTKVTTRPLPPSPPHLECLAVTSNSLKVKWGEGKSPPLLTFTLEMARQGGNFQTVYTGSALGHKVTRLSESTSYRFQIVASNDSGQGPYSDILSITTPRAPPPAVKGLHVRKVEQTSCSVDWSECRGHDLDPLTYVLQLQQTQSGDHDFRQVYTGPDTHHTLQGLEPDTRYQLRVFATRESSDGSSGPFSSLVPFTTPSSSSSTQPLSASDDKRSKESASPTVQGKAWSDEQWALVIVTVLVVAAVVVAVVAQQVMAYIGSSPVSGPSGTSPPQAGSS